VNLQELRTLLDYHYWARDRILDAAEQLPTDQWLRNLGSSFGSIRVSMAPRELRNVLWSYAQRKPHQPIFVDTRPIQIADAVARCVREVGEDTRSRISRVWRSSEHGKVAADAAGVLVIGGGAYYFAPLLREMLPHLDVPKHAEVAHAQGYLAIGQHLPDRVWARLHP